MPRNDSRYRAYAITEFKINSEGFGIRTDDWASREPHAIWYGIPIEAGYSHPGGGTSRWCIVEAFREDGRVVGYVPLPRRYAQAWTQLCYSIVYWMSMWKACLAKLSEPRRSNRQPADMMQKCVENAGCRFAKYLHVRRLIIDELLQHRFSQDDFDQLDVFDEYIIRDRYDCLWTPYRLVSQHAANALLLCPVHPENISAFGEPL